MLEVGLKIKREAGTKNTPALLTPRLYQEMLESETGRKLPGFYLELFSRQCHRDDRERQAMEMYGDRVLDLAVAAEVARARKIVDVGLLEVITRIKSDNKSLALYARRVGLDQMTGASEKDLADRVEMLIGFAFQHSGFNTVKTLLNFDGRNTLIPSEEAVVLAHAMWFYKRKDGAFSKLVRHEQFPTEETPLQANPLASKGRVRLYKRNVLRCASFLGRKAISLGLLTFVRDARVFRSASILVKARELIEVCRTMPKNDLRHGLVIKHGKSVRSVFSPAHEIDVGLSVMKNGALAEVKRLIADEQLRKKMQMLMEKFVHHAGSTRNVTTNRVTLDFLNTNRF